MPCLDETTALAFARGELDADALDAATGHVADCEACRLLVAEAAGPTQIGRFAVEGVAGRGAMGIVYRGRDERLDRPVALKLLRSEALGPGAHARLEREARALAKIDCAHVVRVYEVGDTDGSLFVAMELVEGATLEEWLAAAPRTTAEILARFDEAGEGLLAAHRAGLVHRDFKPSNAMIDAEGRVKVTDFGLVHDGADEPPSAGPVTGVALTQTGMVLGTPAYMAPEQLDARAADPRSDQFSFCVALFEALAGHRPFGGDDLASLAEAVRSGEPAAPRRPIPRAVHKALLRGLARDPADRFPSMRELLDELAAGSRSRTLHWMALAAVSAAVAGAIWLWPRGADRPETACDDAAARWGAVWTPERKQALRDAVAGPKPAVETQAYKLKRLKGSFAVDAVRRFGDDWRSRYVDTCTDGASETTATARLRRSCLVDVLARADALIAAPPAELEPSLQEVRAHLDRCTTHLVQSLSIPDDEAVEAVRTARAALAEATSLRWRGDYARAYALADEAIAAGERTGFPPLLAEAWLERGMIARHAGDAAASIDAHHKAIAFAQQSEYHRVFRHAADNLAWQYFFGNDDHEQARRWLATAEQLDGKVPPTEYELVLRTTLRAQLARLDGKLAEAVAMMEDALRRVEEHDLGAEIAVRTAEGLVTLLYHQRKFDAVPARLDALEQSHGDDPLAQLVIARHRGSLAMFQGKPAEAVPWYERAAELEARPAARAGHLVDAGEAYSKIGKRAEAEQRFADALAADDGAATKLEVACARGAHFAELDRAAAIEAKRECIRLKEAALGPNESVVIFEVAMLGYVYREDGQIALALDYWARALERFAQIGRDDAPVQALRSDYERLKKTVQH